MELLKETDFVEVYHGPYQGKKAIYKYYDADNNEKDILDYLNDKSLNVPKLYEYQSDVISPTNKKWKHLIIIQYFKPDIAYPDTPFNKIPPEIKTELQKFLLRIVEKLHEYDIYHKDLDYANLIYSDGQWYLIDFGQSRFDMKTKPGKSGETQEVNSRDDDHFFIISTFDPYMSHKKWIGKTTKEIAEIIGIDNY